MAFSDLRFYAVKTWNKTLKLFRRLTKGRRIVGSPADYRNKSKNESFRGSVFRDLRGLMQNLSAIQDREICCYSISCKEKDNIDITLQWLISHSNR